MQSVIGVLEAKAQFDAPKHEVHVRIAEHGGSTYIDLGDEEWRAIEITAVGVRPAMNERGDHRREGVARPRVVAEITGDAAHGSSSPAPCCFDAD